MLQNEWLQYAPKLKGLINGDKWNVFISHCYINWNWILNLYDSLNELGYKVFIDQCRTESGKEFTTRPKDALSKSQDGILIWSKDSDWIMQEYQVLEQQATHKKDFQ